MERRKRQGYARLLRDLQRFEWEEQQKNILKQAQELMNEFDRLITRLEELEESTHNRNF